MHYLWDIIREGIIAVGKGDVWEVNRLTWFAICLRIYQCTNPALEKE